LSDILFKKRKIFELLFDLRFFCPGNSFLNINFVISKVKVFLVNRGEKCTNIDNLRWEKIQIWVTFRSLARLKSIEIIFSIYFVNPEILKGFKLKEKS